MQKRLPSVIPEGHHAAHTSCRISFRSRTDRLRDKYPKKPEDEAEAAVDPEPEVASQTSFSMTGSSQENKTNSLKQRIAESLSGNDKELAQKLLSQLLIEQPDNLQARKKLASLYFAQGNFIQTRLLLQQGIEQNPNQADLRLMLARLYTAQKDVPKAMSVLTAHQPSEGNRTDYLAYRAALAQQLNQAQICYYKFN